MKVEAHGIHYVNTRVEVHCMEREGGPRGDLLLTGTHELLLLAKSIDRFSCITRPGWGMREMEHRTLFTSL
jgi:hypothetical protein